MNIIDLRSDTVTQPTPEMREAMARARVGDDVYGEDLTVNLLQEMAADLLGKEAGLFVPSGTMGNLAAILAHCGRGDEVILGHLSHTHLYEAGGIAVLGGVHPRTVTNQLDGTLGLDEIQAAIRSDDPHFPISRLISLENTHNRCGGAVLSVEYGQSVRQLANDNGLLMHLDGARLFNAAVALEVPAQKLAEPFDSITFCLSKALCAPVGSILVGSKPFIAKALRMRKILGGGMRQAGIVAAAGVVALEKMIDRLSEDHQRAATLAQGLAQVVGIQVETENPPSNMVYLHISPEIPISPQEFRQKLGDAGVLVGHVGARRFRLVTHYWVDDQAVQATIQAFSAAIHS